MPTREEALQEILLQMVDRAAAGKEENGALDEDTQAEVDSLAQVALPENLDQLLAQVEAAELPVVSTNPVLNEAVRPE